MAIVGYVEMLLAALCFLILCHWIKTRNSSPLISNWPIVGMLPNLVCNAWRVHEYATELLRQNKGTFEFKGGWIPNTDFILISDPMNVHHICSRNFANYPKGPEFMEIMEPLGDGIFRTDAETWKVQRKMTHAVLHNARFQPFLEKSTLQKVEQGLIPVIERFCKLEVEVDLQDLFQRFTFDIIGLLVFGFDPNSLSVELPIIPHEKAFDDLEESGFSRYIKPKLYWKLLKWLQIGEEKKLKDAWDLFDRFLYKSISLTQEKLSKNKSQVEEEFNLIKAFMEELGRRPQTDSVTSNKILRDHAFNLMAAGRDTVSACLTWFFWLVATNPSVETKILQEIKEKLLENGKLRFSSAKELNALVYLHATFYETLRLYPPVPFNHKTAVEADILPSGHPVAQNTKLLISTYSMGRMQEIWGQDCLEFKPERWISNQGAIMHVPSYKFAAFHTGPRSCLGKDMSFIQMKMIAIAMIWNYHIQLVEGHLIFPKGSVILHMKYGLKVKFANRVEDVFKLKI